MTYKPGPKELQVTQLRLQRAERHSQPKNKKPSTSDLRNQIAKVKVVGKKNKNRGRGR